MFIYPKGSHSLHTFGFVLVWVILLVASGEGDPRLLSASVNCLHPGFLFAPTYSVGTTPYSVVVDDFNRDGRADVAVANRFSNDVSLLLGNSDGTFQAPVNFPVGPGPRSITTGDFNGDGLVDLAVANSNTGGSGGSDSVTGTVSILLGNGKGGFQSTVNYSAGSHPVSITAADLNGDGKLDLAVADNGTFMSDPGRALILLGNGDGTFQFPRSYLVGANPTAIVSADFNGDSKPDLAITSGDQNGLTILPGKGDGSFLPTVSYRVGSFVSLALGDFNADSKLDLALLSSSGEIMILLGNGDGSFQPLARFQAVGSPSQYIAVGDFNGDRKPDLAVVNAESISVLMGHGDGTFVRSGDFVAGYGPTFLAISDFNNDGLPDLVVTNSSSDDISILLGNGDGTFRAARRSTNVFSSPFVATGDFSGDGKPDLVLPNNLGGVFILLGKGDGTYQVSASYETGPGPESVALADFNGDGKTDIAVANSGNTATHFPSPGNVSVLLGNGDGAFQPPVSYTAGNGPFSIAVADFNGDGLMDLMAPNYRSKDLSIFFGNGDGTFQPAINFPLGQQPLFVAVGDFNRDGKADVAMTIYRSNTIILFFGRGDGSFLSTVSINTDSSPGFLLAADFNGDGILDLAAATGTSNRVSLLLGKGDGTFQALGSFPAGLPPFSLAAGDLNSDGRLDLIVTGPAEGFSVLFGNGDGSFRPAVMFHAFYGSPPVAMADFDGDGNPDLAMGSVIFLSRCSSTANTSLPLWVPNLGVGTALTTGTGKQVQAGYAVMNVDARSAANGIAVFSLTQNGVVVSEAGVPASSPTTAARIFVDFRTGVLKQPELGNAVGISVDTGFALVNRGTGAAGVSLTLRNVKGEVLASGLGTLPLNAHRALFLEQLGDMAPGFVIPPDFALATQFGSLDIISDQPLAVLGLRMTTNQRGETLITTTSIADLTGSPSSDRLYFPHLVDGGGYETTLVLMNTSGLVESGVLQFLDDAGKPLVVAPVGGSPDSSFPYQIPPNGALTFQTDGSPQRVNGGWVQLTPDSGSMTPAAAGIFSLTERGILVTESGIPSAPTQQTAFIYIDRSRGHDTGLAIANLSISQMTINVWAFETDGDTPVGDSPSSFTLEANGHAAKFAGEIISGLPDHFTGVLYFYSWPPAPFAALTMRSLTNSRNEFLLTTFSVFDQDILRGLPLVFPQIADGAGYRTEFIVFGAGGNFYPVLNFYGDTGIPIAVGKTARRPGEE